jgi:thioesterase domain-containing protein
MTAPLKPNINDKGIAFGGTLASILALSGWALTDLVLREAGEVADVLIAVATTEYRAPVSARIVARCPLPPPEQLSAFLTAYRLRGRARLKLEAFIETKVGKAALFATYLARTPVKRTKAKANAAGQKPSHRPGPILAHLSGARPDAPDFYSSTVRSIEHEPIRATLRIARAHSRGCR